MGTRGLTVVVDGGKHKVAQYGQWDHYPSGQGLVALEFCKKFVNTESGRADFRKKLDNCHYVTGNEIAVLYGTIGVNCGWITMEQSAKLEAAFPSLHRNTGAEILNLIATSVAKVPLEDSYDFANDPLFCEFAYLIDLDRNKFEVYCGYDRFPVGTGVFQKLALLKSYSLDGLPDNEQFLKELENN